MASSKILSRTQALEPAARRRAAGQTIVFANGAFDLPHVGQTRYLQAARALGQWLLVGVNLDRSVAASKGPNRRSFPKRDGRSSSPLWRGSTR
jgi:D-glycero-beta-D-manno-heptose 1-phosphate adenylyltransferase